MKDLGPQYIINLVYFSCERDKDMLKISIAASRRYYKFNKIFVFVDPNGVIDREEFPSDIIFTNRKAGSQKLYGLNNIKNMHECMKIAATDCDYVLKKDSDILDCSDYAYTTLNKNTLDCYGCFPMAREDLIPPNHFNGNAYFIKSDIINRFPETFPAKVHNWKIMNYPEDMVTSSICSELTKNTKIDGTAQNFGGRYLFDIFLSDTASKSKEEIQNYGFAHCRSNPRVMKYLENKIYENDKT